MVNFGHAIEKPFEDIKKLIIGSFLGIIPLVNFIVIGYFIKNARQSMNKRKKKLPDWEEWGNLFFDGLKAGIISLIYFLVPIAILLGVMFGFIGGMNVSPRAPLTLFLGAGGAAVLFVFLVFGYFLPMALMKFADNREFGSAFQLKDIFDKVFTKKYFGTWVLVAVIGLLLNFVSMIPFLWILLPFMNWIVGIFSYTAFGQVYSELE